MSEPAVDLNRETREQTQSGPQSGLAWFWAYLALGLFFGFVITKAEVISWYRIQEMFRFQGFHMYGVMFSALATAFVGLSLLKRRERRSLEGVTIAVPPKVLGSGTRYWLGGIIFGVGWAFTGACPGPLFALLGTGVGVMVVTLVSALTGTLLYGFLRYRLPH